MEFLKNYSQFFAAFTGSILAVSGGNILAWTTPVLPKLIEEGGEVPPPLGEYITAFEASLITSLVALGGLVGNIFVGKLMNYFGRKRILMAGAPPMFLLWIATYFIKSTALLYVVRFFTGFIASISVPAGAIYITEIAEAHNRGKLTVIIVFMLGLGELMVTAVGSYVSYQNLSLICSIIPIIFFILFYWAPESPYYYLRKEMTEEAENSLSQFRRGSISKELIEMYKSIDDDMHRKSGIRDLIMSKEYKRELIILIGLKTLHQMSGSSVIQSYLGVIFQLASTGFDVEMSTIICTSVTIPALFVSFYVVDKFGRKPLYYMSTIGCTIALLLEFAYFLLQDTLKMNMDWYAWVPLTGIFLFYIFRSLGVTTLSTLLMGEIFPVNVKGAAVSFGLFYQSCLAFAITFGYPLLVEWWGMAFPFLIFALCCILGFIFVLFVVPETKDKSLVEIQNTIRKNVTRL